MLLVKKCQLFVFFLDLVKIRLAIMLSDIAQKKESFLTINNRIFQSKKSNVFSNGLTFG